MNFEEIVEHDFGRLKIEVCNGQFVTLVIDDSIYTFDLLNKADRAELEEIIKILQDAVK